mgnify:CR=1 FL=1
MLPEALPTESTDTAVQPNRRFCIAPMMDYSDRHSRYFLRLFSPRILLYTEMVTAAAIQNGDREYLLRFNAEEHPLAVQLGGSDPEQLYQVAKICSDFGFDEINLNCGCPSDRVQSGSFGACLMKDAALVADCVAAMKSATRLPVTVKHRTGIDQQEDYDEFAEFARVQIEAGADALIVHARNAWLQGLNPKQNREIPPLKGPTRVEMLHRYYPYIESQLSLGLPLMRMARHLIGLFHGEPNARLWRRYLSENAHRKQAGMEVLYAAEKLVV